MWPVVHLKEQQQPNKNVAKSTMKNFEVWKESGLRFFLAIYQQQQLLQTGIIKDKGRLAPDWANAPL